MSILDRGVVDFISEDLESGHVVLTVSDHLDWSDVRAHLFALQNKVNDYLSFVESGDLLESYPAAKDAEVRIDVVGAFDQPDLAKKFMQAAAAAAAQLGVELQFRLHEPETSS